ncbi:putative CDP-diacylglycerol--glycerol-3-phosphate 3-phosphatidyl-transferase 1 [Nostocoides japonicum T1-X7]|uniref:Putative CDP-diacylglycerol--glycerol-3-phosphate 3-phosphatidyl-transferase 1 n=1 Tax=Nostocoides japonicum T1-X7 TaxID=1194083 RepID=A0A077M6G6_9MICO|nr:CDP-alcohol phosphatidyltransferase family protein [Tetrasphaera japonica]CCH79630.1 putative CDP-diacylglycerol--glycerol-3-phosphate 3-phosphatidyl-transferase 1 [Tetrasphaera japonica T1-X7]
MSDRVGETRGTSVSHPVTDRVLTVPNVLSALRLVGVPVFLWAILAHHDALALVLLVASGVTDYLDGKIARRYGLESRLGQLLDPVADRLYIVSTLVGLGVRGIVPWWLAAVLFAREAYMGVVILVGRRHGIPALPVHFLGKAATFSLLYAFPLLLLGDGTNTVAEVARVAGWAFTWWGTGLYWVAGILYAVQLRQYIRAREVPA